MRCLTILLISFALQQVTNAQLPPTFQIRYYNTENGLPSNSIKGIQWDKETGFLWFATEAGVVRFNGVNFKTFNTQNTPFIATERMGVITRNNQGTIYVADLDNNILKVFQNSLRFHLKT